MTLALQDQRQQYEAKHDLAACADVAKITPITAYQDALLASLADYAQAAQDHELAAAALQDELSDSDRHRITIQSTREALWPHYLRVQLNAQAALLAPDVDEPLPPADLEERQLLLARTFPLSRTDFMRESYESLWSTMREVARLCTTHTLLKPLKLTKTLQKSMDRYGEDLAAYQADLREDRDAQAALNSAREALTIAALAHKRLVLAVLTPQRREAELGRFIRTEDAAYAARRAANKPVDEEPQPVEA